MGTLIETIDTPKDDLYGRYNFYNLLIGALQQRLGADTFAALPDTMREQRYSAPGMTSFYGADLRYAAVARMIITLPEPRALKEVVSPKGYTSVEAPTMEDCTNWDETTRQRHIALFWHLGRKACETLFVEAVSAKDQYDQDHYEGRVAFCQAKEEAALAASGKATPTPEEVQAHLIQAVEGYIELFTRE